MATKGKGKIARTKLADIMDLPAEQRVEVWVWGEVELCLMVLTDHENIAGRQSRQHTP